MKTTPLVYMLLVMYNQNPANWGTDPHPRAVALEKMPSMHTCKVLKKALLLQRRKKAKERKHYQLDITCFKVHER